MRILSLLVFGLSALTAMAAPNFVNLDAPGALEALSRDHPADYAKVVEAMERIQAVPYSPQGQHNLFADIRQPDPTRADIQTSFPGKAHISVPVNDTVYRITVLYTTNPPKNTPVK